MRAKEKCRAGQARAGPSPLPPSPTRYRTPSFGSWGLSSLPGVWRSLTAPTQPASSIDVSGGSPKPSNTPSLSITASREASERRIPRRLTQLRLTVVCHHTTLGRSVHMGVGPLGMRGLRRRSPRPASQPVLAGALLAETSRSSITPVPTAWIADGATGSARRPRDGHWHIQPSHSPIVAAPDGQSSGHPSTPRRPVPHTCHTVGARAGPTRGCQDMKSNNRYGFY